MGPGEIAAVTSGSTMLGSVITWLLTRRHATRQLDQAEDSGNRADWARFTGEMRASLDAERVRADAQTERIDQLRERLDVADGARRGALDHIDVLEAHIWAQKPPPPPARPEGL